MPAVEDVARAYDEAAADPAFIHAHENLLRDYVGRPSPLTEAKRLSDMLGVRIFLKREDLNHTGAHKINHTLGQILLAQRLGKERIIAETGAGQHGVATATACALMGLGCVVYMGAVDVDRQALNVQRMQLLGAELITVKSGSQTLKDAINDAFRDWAARPYDTYYCIGTVTGPDPYPRMVRDFQSIVGREVKQQLGSISPDLLVACVGGGSNAIGLFHPFLESDIAMVGVEAGGRGMSPGDHGATLTMGSKGVLHGTSTYMLQNDDGQVIETHSISAGLDYPGVGPEHAALKTSGRVDYYSVSDAEALAAFRLLTKLEGILPALESSHALAWIIREASFLKGKTVVMNLSGRGDKDLGILAENRDSV